MSPSPPRPKPGTPHGAPRLSAFPQRAGMDERVRRRTRNAAGAPRTDQHGNGAHVGSASSSTRVLTNEPCLRMTSMIHGYFGSLDASTRIGDA